MTDYSLGRTDENRRDRWHHLTEVSHALAERWAPEAERVRASLPRWIRGEVDAGGVLSALEIDARGWRLLNAHESQLGIARYLASLAVPQRVLATLTAGGVRTGEILRLGTATQAQRYRAPDGSFEVHAAFGRLIDFQWRTASVAVFDRSEIESVVPRMAQIAVKDWEAAL